MIQVGDLVKVKMTSMMVFTVMCSDGTWLILIPVGHPWSIRVLASDCEPVFTPKSGFVLDEI
jgi:hypothetical protein